MSCAGIARFVAVGALVVWCRTAVAANGRGIPVSDLPPFPELSSDTEKVADVSVYGAASTEADVVVGAAKREQSLGTVASAVTVITSISCAASATEPRRGPARSRGYLYRR